MAKAELKTKKTNVSVPGFLNTIKEEGRRKDCFTILEMMKKATAAEPKMWGSIVGFGDVALKYASGRELDWFCCGFASRKKDLSLYLSFDIKQHGDLLKKLGKHKTGMGCLYISKLDDVNLKVLEELIETALKKSKEIFSKG